jgi:hypothetical protein
VPDFGFVGPSYTAASRYQDAQEAINWYCEIDPYRKERGVIALYPAPGSVVRIALPAGGPVRGFRVIPGGAALLAVAADTLYRITAGWVATAVGTLLTNAGLVSISDNGVSAYICDGANRYYYTWGTNTFALIADGAFPSGGIVDIVDGFLVYTNPGTDQFGATSANLVTSGALSFATKFSAPDNIMGLQVVNRDVYVVGEKTTEVWTDSGLFPFPFQIIGGTSMQHGTDAAFSISRLGEGFAMLAEDTRGANTVILVNAYKPSRISTYAVEDAINGYAYTADAIGMTHQWGGHEFYMLTFPSADVTWVYDLSTQLWHKRAYRDANGVLHRHRANCMAFFNNEVVTGDFQNGNIYAFTDTAYDDNGVPQPCIRRCPHLTDDLKRQFFHDLQIQFQPGVGLQTGQGADPQAMLTWSDDGGSTWSAQHWTSIGRAGAYKNRAIWRRLGQARDRIFEVQVTDPVYRVIVSANLNVSQGAH